MKQTILIILSIISLSFISFDNNLTQDIIEARLKIDLPNNEWSLAKKQTDTLKDYTVYFFKRSPIKDSRNVGVIPNISLIVQGVDKNIDIKTWAEKRNAKTPFTISDDLTYDNGKIKFKDAIGYKGTYDGKNGINHTIYVVYVKNDDRGVQIICDVTTELIGSVEQEFIRTINSITK